VIRVDGVAAVVSGAILDVGDQFTFRLFAWLQFIQAFTRVAEVTLLP